MQIHRARTYQKIKKTLRTNFFLQFIMCHKLPYIWVDFWEESNNFQLNPSNSILNCAKDVVGFETLFVLPERGPTSLPACKFTPMKIDNLSFSARTTQNELKIKKCLTWQPLFSKMVTIQKSQICLLQEKSAKQPISFYISFSFVPHGITYRKITKF